ncbi:hypothetical protein ACFXA8_38175, partial [Streptomyces sp. NPDC059409]
FGGVDTPPPPHPRGARVSWDSPHAGGPGTGGGRPRDELTGETYHWGRANYVRLEPGRTPAHVCTVLRPSHPQIGGSPTT